MIAGVDEAGRGPVIGPLVVCGVAIESDGPLREIGVRDSKKLTSKRREELDAKIRHLARVEVVEAPADEIDAMRMIMTMNELEAKLFATVIGRLEPEVAYVDAADTNEARFGRMVLKETTAKCRMFSRHKSDENVPVVSAASIVAKVVRDARIAEIEKAIGEPIGSGYASDPHTMSFLRNWIAAKGTFPPHTRRTWEPAKNLMRLNKLRRLDSFEG